jgi:dethiobiotin synthetase
LKNVLFITGTGTNVGKTMLTALLLRHLRENGQKALAMKPFCSGSRADLRILSALQDHELPERLLNPFYFPKPVAPAACDTGVKITLKDAVARIAEAKRCCDLLLVEGAGGLMVPIGEDWCVIDLVAELKCPVVIVSPNRLGTLNHTLLTVDALHRRRIRRQMAVMMNQPRPDASASTNMQILQQKHPLLEALRLPYLGKKAAQIGELKKNARKLKKAIALVTGFATFCAPSTTGQQTAPRKVTFSKETF